MKWIESGFRPPLCTYRLNWARRTSWGWWNESDDTVLQTQDSKFEPWRSEAEHACKWTDTIATAESADTFLFSQPVDWHWQLIWISDSWDPDWRIHRFSAARYKSCEYVPVGSAVRWESVCSLAAIVGCSFCGSILQLKKLRIKYPAIFSFKSQRNGGWWMVISYSWH